MSKIKVAFFGSSEEKYDTEIEIIFQCLFDVFDEVVIINGGYQGTMLSVSEIGRRTAAETSKRIFIQGILFDGYKNDPDQSGVNTPNSLCNVHLSSKTIGDRVQSMIELADMVISMPGKTGTLQEIIQTIETIRYGMDYSVHNYKRILIHNKWKKSLDDLYSNGNMSEQVFNNLSGNYFSFDSKKDKKKEQFKTKIKSIKDYLSQNKKYANLDKITSVTPVFKFVDEGIAIDAGHRIAQIVSFINETLFGKYFDGSQNCVVGFDVAIKEKSISKEKLLGLDTVGSQRYILALAQFLKKYKSIIDINKAVDLGKNSEWMDIDCVISEKIDKLYYHDHIKEESEWNGEEEATLNDWLKIIQEKRLGKSLFWTSVSLGGQYFISAFLLLDVYVSQRIKDEIEKLVNKILLEDALIKVSDERNKVTKGYAKKAAISQVLARTTSHNTGSHILSNSLSEYDINDIESFRVYLRQRMLFNADLTSNSSKSYSPVRLFDVAESFKCIEIVKRNISGLENCFFSEFRIDKNLKDATISLPNGVLGYHALYIIFENLIRNYFKHGNGTGANITVWEDVKYLDISINQLHNLSNDFYFSIDISDGSEINSEKHKRIESLIDNPILNENDELRSEGLGYLEIKAALCYINNIPFDEIDSPYVYDLHDNKTSNKVFAIRSLKPEDNSLHYRIFLPKPFIVKASNSKILNKELLRSGIVDSITPTTFDSRCQYYFGLQPSNPSGVSPRVLSKTFRFNHPSEFMAEYFSEVLGKLIDKVSIINLKQTKDFQGLKFLTLQRLESGYNFIETPFSPGKCILLDDHTGRLNIVLRNNDKLGNYFYEDFKGDSHFGTMIRNVEQLNEEPFFIQKIIEAFFTKIIIIDERIQKYSELDYSSVNSNYKTDAEEPIKTKLVLGKSGIAIPEKSLINLNSPDIDRNVFCDNLKTFIESEILNCDLKPFVLIHLGIIEKLTDDKSPKSITNVIERIKPNSLSDDSIVIISERGTPKNIEPMYRFMHYSNVARNLIEEKSKYFLLDAVFASRCLINS